ncbi:MAG: cysteine--tRNA ligase [Phycisphaerales bacterium]|jgi:cysteinyl-tRNA synthetase|nr:cysteine--tRNA ligase [Phycisphaerales bacterium]
MSITLYNTMTRSKDPLTPRDGDQVSLYTCGPTVYNYAHIGNLRTYVFEDILKRALIYRGYTVNHVMNVTDVGHLVSDADDGEDKMALGAEREGKTVWEIAQFYWDAFRADIERLNIIEPTIWCRATEHIEEQIQQVQLLEEKGFTYTIDDGVYFDTSKLDDYGKLARLDIEGLRAGARIEVTEGKKNYTDFALWKLSPKNSTRLMEWESPWGMGFPGWHLECSTMAMKYLGEYLDIHCGGIDHIAVHHTNEIAQAESALGHEWTKCWMHGEFLTLAKSDDSAGGKMSKSSGEFLTMDVLIDKHNYDPIAYRYFLLGAHYRQQLAFSWEGMDAAASALARLKRIVLSTRDGYTGEQEPLTDCIEEFDAAVVDDLNMPRALAAMWKAAKNTTASPGEVYATLLHMDCILGLGIAEMAPVEIADGADEEIDALVEARTTARAEKDYARGDEIRDQLAEMGIEIMDSPEGTTWRRI